MNLHARNFASKLKQKVIERNATMEFGGFPRYRNIYYGEDEQG